MSTPPEPPVIDRSMNRRRFLRHATLVCGAVGSVRALPALATTAAATGRPRILSFVHTHTGETLVAPYFNGSCYDTDCMRNINHLLRDFRTGESVQMDPQLLDILYDLQTLADREAPFEIISGYRSPQTNAMLHRRSSGVANKSQHMLGKAVDIRLGGYPTQRLSEFARSLARGGVGFYPTSDFVHVDTGRVRYW